MQEQDLLREVQKNEAHTETLHAPPKVPEVVSPKTSPGDGHDMLPCGTKLRDHDQKNPNSEGGQAAVQGTPLAPVSPSNSKPYHAEAIGMNPDKVEPAGPSQNHGAAVTPNAISQVVVPCHAESVPSQPDQKLSVSAVVHESEEAHKSSEFDLFHNHGIAPATDTSSTAHAVVPHKVSPYDSGIFTADSPFMQSIASPIWEASGAISAFATRPNRCATPQTPCVVQQHVAEGPVQHPILSSSPKELVEQGVLVYDADLHSISIQKCSPDATFAQWCVANQAMGIPVQGCWDLFGCPIDPTTPLVQLKWIVVGSSPIYHGASDLETITNILAHMPRIESALLHGPAVASDEMMFYLTAISAVGLAKAK